MKLQAFVLLSGGSFKTQYKHTYNIRETDSLEDQWSNYCTIALIYGKIYIHNSFFGRLPSRPSLLKLTYTAILAESLDDL